jgi:ubiquinone/menaquinone biosynthesis C-methylase UbiE/uncharacterized protein YbaR (Trm112 family)
LPSLDSRVVAETKRGAAQAALGDDAIALLACPVCRARLAEQLDGLACATGHRFEIREGVPLLASEVRPFDRSAEWEQKQQAAIPEYQAEIDDPESRGAAAVWTVGRLFGEFWSGNLSRATVLDVGCGPYSDQSYFRASWNKDRVARLVGVDPIFRAGQREYEFVQGVAESLPFADSVFDVVLYATSLDHVADVDTAMLESARVLKPGGTLAIWISVFDPGLHKTVSSALKRVTRQSLRHPRALASYLRVVYALERSRRVDWRDQYHLHRFELSELRGHINRAGFSVSKLLLLDDGVQSVPHTFLLAGRG